MQHYISVLPGVKVRGFTWQNFHADDRAQPTRLDEALSTRWPSDAHAVAYWVPDRAGKPMAAHPRINKPGLHHWDGKEPVASVFFADVDNPGKQLWTPGLFAEAMALYQRVPMLQTCGIFHTRRGARLVQPINRLIPVSEFEPYWHAWLRALKEAGVEIDPRCVDWTRLFRLLWVVRDGKPTWEDKPFVRLDTMTAIEPPEPDPQLLSLARARTELTGDGEVVQHLPPPEAIELEWRNDVAPDWTEKVSTLAPVVARVPSGERHAMYLPLSGALCNSRQIDLAAVPAIVHAIALTGGDEEADGRRRTAESTVQRKLARQPIQGWTTLRRSYRPIADTLDLVLATGRRAELAKQALAEPVKPSGDIAAGQARVREAIEKAPPGVTVIKAPCGFGKTHIGTDVAAQRAAKTQVSPKAAGLRAPDGSKTGFTTPTNALAKQIVGNARRLTPLVARHFGALSVYDKDGEPVCIHHEAASRLVAGGQSVRKVYCEGGGSFPCEKYDDCPARIGVEGPEDARIRVGPHGLGPTIGRQIGETGMLVLDEPPAPVEQLRFTLAQIGEAKRFLHAFSHGYTRIMRPVIDELQVWTQTAEIGPDKPLPLMDLVEWNADPDQIASELDAALQNKLGQRSSAPPLTMVGSQQARNPSLAAGIGIASRLLSALQPALLQEGPVSLWVEERDGERILRVLRISPLLAAAFVRPQTVLLDANADVNLPIYEKLLGYKPHLLEVRVGDGAPIERIVLEEPKGSRRSWTPGGKLALGKRMLRSIQRAFARLGMDADAYPGPIGVITYHVLELALRATEEPDKEEWEDEWEAAGQPAKVLQAVRDKLEPIIGPYRGRLRYGHYGAIRGLDHMAQCDQILTLGDPRPNIDGIKAELAFLGIDIPWDQRVEAHARAELEQAHGRLRAVHRGRPARCIHLGVIAPGGWAGRCVVEADSGGRPAVPRTMTREELEVCISALGGVRRAAACLGVSPSAVAQWRSGKRAIPTRRAAALRTVCQSSC